MKILYVISFLLVAQFFTAQEHVSSFNSLTVNYKFHPKFFVFAELQSRGIEEYSYPDYYEVKGGIGYNLTENHKPALGIGRFASYENRVIDKEEFRVWLQDVIDFKIGPVKFENRVRVEKSWFYAPQTDVHSDRMRYRYRLNVSVPLNSKTVEPGTLSTNVYEEVFFVSPMKPSFARNRLYAGFGYQIDDNIGIASGYLWQREFSASKNENFHFIYLALNISLSSVKDTKKFYDYPGAD